MRRDRKKYFALCARNIYYFALCAQCMVFGMFLADFAKDFITGRLNNMNIEQGGMIGSIAKFGILLIVFSMILSQLNIGNDLVSKLTQYLFGAIALGLAIAIGLGGKDAAKSFFDKLTKK